MPQGVGEPPKVRGSAIHDACRHMLLRVRLNSHYAASLNIAALGSAFLVHYCETEEYSGFRMTSAEVKPCSYSGRGGAPLLRLQGITPRPKEGKHVYYAGWSYTLRLCTSQRHPTLSWLCTAQFRKRLLLRA